MDVVADSGTPLVNMAQDTVRQELSRESVARCASFEIGAPEVHPLTTDEDDHLAQMPM